ncbi:hypothetical protein D1224_06700 [Henriciella barbarensis]|uniref:Uncharacterized protein n=1 Tax=Henriciella barbarensis TaxID=86342 RepID=A0A399R0D5_9PROT|nr:hypothetical protein D1224_06700 [Henriciella barbarensis]
MIRRLIKNRPWVTTSCAVVGLILLAVGTAWLLRQSIARHYTERWCASNELTCRFEIDRLNFSGVILSDISVANQTGKVPLEAGNLEVALDWPGLFSPSIQLVDVEDPVIRLDYNSDGSVTLGGLEDIAASDSSADTPLDIPAIRLRNARLEIATPAGEIEMYGDVNAQLPLQAEIHARAEPADLRTEQGRLKIKEGRLDLSIIGAAVQGSARFQLDEARFDAYRGRGILLDASLSPSLRPSLEFTLEAEESAAQDFAARDLRLTGTAGLNPGKLDTDEHGAIGFLRSLAISADAATLRFKMHEMTSPTLTLDAGRARSGPLEGTLAIDTEAAMLAGISLGRSTLTGEGEVGDRLEKVELAGDLTIADASLPAAMSRDILSPLRSGPPFTAHGTSLRSGLAAAMAQFRLGTSYRFGFEQGDGWTLETSDKITATAANGAQFSLSPAETERVLTTSNGRAELSGVASLKGPSLPSVDAYVKQANISAGGVLLETGRLRIAPWRADGLTLSTNLEQLVLNTQAAEPGLQAVGTANISGQMFGLDFADTSVFGGVDARLSEPLRVQSFRTRCIGLKSDGFTSPDTLRVGAFMTELCPQDGRLLRRANGAISGQLGVASLELPFESESTSGTLALTDGVLDWRAASTARLNLTGRQMMADLKIGENTLVIAAARPELGFETGRPLSISARTRRTELTGSLIPALIDIETLTLDATLPETGIAGSGSAGTVIIRDKNEDPFYEPLQTDLSAEFANGIMQLSGPLRTRYSQREIADLQVTLDIVELDGEASLRSRDLVFEAGGFQPTALSERVRGLLSNARGRLNAGASLLIDGGTLSGTGFFEVRDFGFDTLRVGAVNNINGRIEFDELLELHTPPGQTVTVGEINPGLPLRNGEIGFQILGPDTAIIEHASWPFAGGTLLLGQSQWTIAGTSDIVEITAQNIELSRLIEVFSLPDIEANGTVSGTFPVELQGANVFIRDAILRADEEGGKIAYTGSVADAASQADERVDMAFRALRNFEFSVLEVGANGNLTGNMMITLELVGTSPDVLGGAPFAFNIGVDSELSKLIRSSQSVTGTDWLAEVRNGSLTGDSTSDDDGDKNAAAGDKPSDP